MGMALAEYAEYDGLGLAKLVADGDVTTAELVEAAIARVDKHNPTINAVVYKMYDQARDAAAKQQRAGRGPGRFQGVPMLLKDLLGDYEGVPSTRGCRFMTGVPALQDQTLVVRYKDAGLIALGKTNVPECGILPTTECALYGPTKNPWNLAYSVGGSSGGSAAAVAAGIVPIAHANDGGGSIRIPAACCGLVGVKPTRARNPLGPDLGDIMSGLVAEHVVTRTVRDSAAVLDCTHGSELGDPYCAPPVTRPFLEEVTTPPGALRIAFSTKNLAGEPLAAECVAGIEATAKLCEELGHVVEEGAPDISLGIMTDCFMAVWTSGLAMGIDAFALLNSRAPSEDDLEGFTWALYEQGRQVSAARYQLAVAMIQMSARQVARFHQTYDCWLTTTLGAPVIKNGVIDVHERDLQKIMEMLYRYVPFTPIQNATGQPAMSLPLHWSADGLPMGIMFTGRFGDEATLYRLAGQLEQARPWSHRKPSIWN